MWMWWNSKTTCIKSKFSQELEKMGYYQKFCQKNIR